MSQLALSSSNQPRRWKLGGHLTIAQTLSPMILSRKPNPNGLNPNASIKPDAHRGDVVGGHRWCVNEACVSRYELGVMRRLRPEGSG